MFKFQKIFKKNVPQVSKEVQKEVQKEVPIELLKASLKNYAQYKSEKEIRDEIKRRQDLKLIYISWLGYIDDILDQIDARILDRNNAVKNGDFASNHISLEIAKPQHQLYFWQMLKGSIEEKFGNDVLKIYVRYVYGTDYHSYCERSTQKNYLEIFLNLDGLKITTFEETYEHTFKQHNIINDFISITNHRDRESERWVDCVLSGRDIQTNLTEESFKFLNESRPNA